MQLDPDEIERRSFAIEDRGYDRDEVRAFLLELATELRALADRPTATDDGATDDGDGDGSDRFAQLGAEVADVLRSAHEAVAGLHREAEVEIAARHEQADADAEAVRRQARSDAASTHDEARRVLVTAQDQARTILADAEAAAAEVVAAARREAREHTEELAARTRRHAEQVLRAEREALRRLHQAQAGVAAAVELLSGSDTRPVVDLTELRPHLRLGDLPPEHDVDDRPMPVRSADDPVLRMVRRAVARAAEAARDGAPTTDAAGGAPAGAAAPDADRPRPVVPPGPARAPAVPRRVESPPAARATDGGAPDPTPPRAGPLPPHQAAAPPTVAPVPAGPARPLGGTPF